MIVRPKLHWIRLVFVWHGSVLYTIMFRLLLNLAMSVVAVYFMPTFEAWGLHMSTAPFSLIGIALAIFLGFRNSASYDRFWEARKLWGMLLVGARYRSCLSLWPELEVVRTLAQASLRSGVWKGPGMQRILDVLTKASKRA